MTSADEGAARSSDLRSLLAESGLTPRARLGRVVAAGAAILIPLFLLLPYVSTSSAFGGGVSATGWETLDGSDILLLLASIGIVALLIVDVFAAPSKRLVAAAAALSFVSVPSR